MNDSDNTDTNDNTDNTDTNDTAGTNGTAPTPGEAPPRPLGYWLRAVEHRLDHEFARAFEREGVSRREWMILNVLDGTVEAPHLAERIQRGKKLRPLLDRGWVEETEGTWQLTDNGRHAKERLGAAVDGIRDRVAGAVDPDDFATTLRSLEAIARELGWSEAERMPFGPRRRGERGRRGFRPGGFGNERFGHAGFGHGDSEREGFGRGDFGPRGYGRAGFGHGNSGRDEFGPRGFAREAGGFGPHRFGPDLGAREMHGECGHHHGAHHGAHHGGSHHRGGHRAQRAYERGFDAGFSRGREDRSA